MIGPRRLRDPVRSLGIPELPPIPMAAGVDQTWAMLAALKHNVETLNGARGEPISKLASNASLEDVVKTVNLIIERLSYGRPAA